MNLKALAAAVGGIVRRCRRRQEPWLQRRGGRRSGQARWASRPAQPAAHLIEVKAVKKAVELSGDLVPGCITMSSEVAICIGFAPQLRMSLIFITWVPSVGCKHDADGLPSVALLAVAGGTDGAEGVVLEAVQCWMTYPSPHRLHHPYLCIPQLCATIATVTF